MPRQLAKTAARGYGYEHQQLRVHYQQRMDAGERFNCWRCGGPINPQRWDLGHDEGDRSKYKGPEHRGRECPAGGNRGVAKRFKGIRNIQRWRL